MSTTMMNEAKRQFTGCWGNRTTNRKAFNFQYVINGSTLHTKIKSKKRDTPEKIFSRFIEAVEEDIPQASIKDLQIIEILGVL